MTLNADPAGPSADSYVTISEADAYFSADYEYAGIWNGLPEEDRTRLLVSAARRLDRTAFKGRPFDERTPQALAFPRLIGGLIHAVDSDGRVSIPLKVRQAVCEQARSLHQSGDGEDLACLGLESVQVGRLRIAGGAGRGRGLCPAARRLLAPYILHSVEVKRS